MPGVLDAGFALSKDETRTVLVVTSVLALPLTLLSVFLQRQYFGDDALGGVVNAFTQEPIRVDGRRVSDNTIVFVQIAVILASSLRVTLVAAALGPMMLARHRGISMTPGQLLSGVARRLPVVLVGWTMVKPVAAAHRRGPRSAGAHELAVNTGLVVGVHRRDLGSRWLHRDG